MKPLHQVVEICFRRTECRRAELGRKRSEKEREMSGREKEKNMFVSGIK